MPSDVSTTKPSDLEDFYERHSVTLIRLATSKFNLPSDEAEQLAHDVLLANLRHLTSSNLETRLTASLTEAVRHSRTRS